MQTGKAIPKTIDEYLEPLSSDKRAALQKLRKMILSAAPKAIECISYQIPAFRLNGRMLVAFGAAANHCSFYPGAFPVEAFKKELKGYSTSKGTIRFQPEKTLPVSLVRTLVKARIAEYAWKSIEAKKPRPAKSKSTTLQTDPAVISFLRELKHPMKSELGVLRRLILNVSPKIHEGIKWNSPSFRTTDYFATINLRGKGGKDRVWLILHTGAKPKASAKRGLKIADSAGLLKWLGKDRCLVTFGDEKEIRAKRSGLQTIIREWIRQL